MKNLLTLIVLAGLVMAASLAAAADGMTITPINKEFKTYDISALKGGSPQGNSECCKVGNLNWNPQAVDDFIGGNEKFSYIFPVDPVCGCDTGFYFDKVHILVVFGPEDVPVTIQGNASFEETQMDPTGGHLIPGPPICTSPTYTATFTEPGAYEVTIPMTEANCACAEFGWDYAITVNIVTPLENKLSLVVDDNPVGGVSWIDQGNGWYDMQSAYRLPGEIKMAAKLRCCSNPVPDEQNSWGSLKAMFR